jgi:orotate phosphoribosyltransferase
VQGGQLVGAAVAGRRVLIVDDVITAGTAIRQSVQLLREAGAQVVGVAVCLDRQELTSEESGTSAVQVSLPPRCCRLRLSVDAAVRRK